MIIELNPNCRQHPYDYFEEDEDASPDNPYLDEDEEQRQIEAMAQIRATASEFVEFAIFMPVGGRLTPFSFKNRRYLRAIYDTPAKRKLICAGRQVEKSTLLGNTCLSYAAMNPFFRVLYVSPSNQQTKVFSRDRIKEPMEISPVLRHFTNTKLLLNVLEKKFVNQSQITLRFAFLNADRCIAGDTLVQLSDGSLTPIRELGGKKIGPGVVSAYPESFKPCMARAENARSTGVRKVVELHTTYPVPIKLTPDHRVLTSSGWKEAQELDEGDFILAPHVTAQMPKSIGEDTAWILGAMTAEGACKDPREVKFSNTDEEFFLEFCERAEKIGVSLGKTLIDTRYETPCYTVNLYSDSKGPGINGAKKILWDLGEWGEKSYDKHIPATILTAPIAEKAIFLQALFNGDGWCCDEGGFGRAGYSTSSRRLAEQLCHMLWSMGIRSSLRTRPPSTDNAKESYILDFSTSDTAKLIDFIGTYRQGLDYREQAARNVKDRIPVSYLWLRRHLKKVHGLSTHTAWTQHRIQLRPGNRKDSIGRRVLSNIAEKLDDDFLRDLLSPQMSWVEVKEVVPAGEEEVFDLSVPGTEAFVANGLVVHNCRGIPSDLIEIDEFQDILLENVPVIEECASHSEHKLFIYSGTPKSLDNSLEHYWSRFSTQNEWGVPCKHHGTPKNPSSWHWNILEEDNVGNKFLICDKCGKLIDPAGEDCRWMSMNPKPKVEKPFEGYRLPQLMVPWIDFSDIKHKQKAYSRAKFHNEVLGRSYDSGTRPLTRADVMKNSWDALSMSYYRDVIKWCQQYPIFMGLDWGCHDDQTRILTERGFVHFKDLTDDDKVAQFDQETREMTFVKPLVRTVKSWNKPLIHFKTQNVDMMVTHTHRMLFDTVSRARFEVRTAGELEKYHSKIKFVGSIDWAGEEIEEFTLSSLPSSAGYSGCEPITLPMDQWLEFLGYYLSEGGLCFNKGRNSNPHPSCLKFSQRVIKDKGQVKKLESQKRVKQIRSSLKALGLKLSEFPNLKTGDVNWALYGKQIWSWVELNVGKHGSTKRIPREFLSLSKRQLQILFDAMMLGDGSADKRKRNFNGCYTSTSKGLCDDFMELCIRLGLRASVRLHKPAEGNRKARWRVSWSSGKDHCVNFPDKMEKVPYRGKVYCCKVPTGFIVTERNGKVAYQGNTGEGSFTVMTLGGYLPFAPEKFTYFYWRHFEGIESEPRVQLEIIKQHVRDFNVKFIGVDYGGGFWPNDELVREFGSEKIKKYQWVGQVKKKIVFEPRLGVPRYLCHRTEVMSDIFNAIKRGDVFRYPRWEEFEDPFASEFLNIFSEYNERARMNVYKHAAGHPDDSFHSSVYCFLASYFYKVRPDVILPQKEVDQDHQGGSREDLDIV